MRITALLAAAILVGPYGCKGDNNSGAGGSGGSNDGGVQFADGAMPPADGGWVVGDGGQVIIVDGGGVVITEDGGFTFTCNLIQCDNRITACGDCSDNDGDGLVDWRDPECLGPCDNYEGEELLAGIGGEAASSARPTATSISEMGGQRRLPLEPKLRSARAQSPVLRTMRIF